ncbi:hypothetical protein D7Z54_11885 [Salibacterium salarium]|uniref:Transposase IS204/IS1001/IS1096/IS1165 DDE domain-containing protein n=1 Tax=Salibacterium salarium TaxID=284579 RepID=A0A428N4A8_9BACI|nr:transposase [Salibacterium salarium]RSL33310.1 hypothetical protein D7Z54_11885 [Salibacterium salarium]
MEQAEASGIVFVLEGSQNFSNLETGNPAFVYVPYNNGYIEGINNTTKVIKRASYGIKSFERLKNKILWRQQVHTTFKHA